MPRQQRFLAVTRQKGPLALHRPLPQSADPQGISVQHLQILAVQHHEERKGCDGGRLMYLIVPCRLNRVDHHRRKRRGYASERPLIPIVRRHWVVSHY